MSGYQFSAHRKGLAHQKKMAKDEFKCVECNREFDNAHNFYAHLDGTAHLNRVTKDEWKCEMCNREFMSEFSLYAHLRGRRHLLQEERKRLSSPQELNR